MQRSLKERLIDAPSAEWAVAKVEGLVYEGKLYKPSDLQEGRHIVTKPKRKGGPQSTKRAVKEQKAEGGLRRPTLILEDPLDPAHAALRIALRHDISVRVSWWGAKDNRGRVSAISGLKIVALLV